MSGSNSSGEANLSGGTFRGRISPDVLRPTLPDSDEPIVFYDDPVGLQEMGFDGLGLKTYGDLIRATDDTVALEVRLGVLVDSRQVINPQLDLFAYWLGVRNQGAASFFLFRQGDPETGSVKWLGVAARSEGDQESSLEDLFTEDNWFDIEVMLDESVQLETSRAVIEFIRAEGDRVHKYFRAAI